MKKMTLLEALVPLEESKKDLIIQWAKQHNLLLTNKGPNQYKVQNGCIPNIMFYPTKLKLMFQEEGQNYIITSRNEEGILGLINGHLPYKKTGE